MTLVTYTFTQLQLASLQVIALLLCPSTLTLSTQAALELEKTQSACFIAKCDDLREANAVLMAVNKSLKAEKENLEVGSGDAMGVSFRA